MYARVNGTELYFDVEGASLRRHGATLADKLTLVALHGAGFDHAYLRPPLSPLTETAQIVYLDHRGQGRSGATEVDTWTVEHTADDVAGLWQVLGIRRPFILDHSFGVFVALAVALRYSYLCGKSVWQTHSREHGTADRSRRSPDDSRRTPRGRGPGNRLGRPGEGGFRADAGRALRGRIYTCLHSPDNGYGSR